MRWRNAWIIMRKDLDEFKKQKLVIGSIIAMPIVLGVIMPLAIFVPLVSTTTATTVWDVPGLLETGSLPGNQSVLWTNQTLSDVSLSSKIIKHTVISHAHLSNCLVISCIINNSTVDHSTIEESNLTQTYLSNTTVTYSKGTGLDGSNILAVQSSLFFTKTKPSALSVVLPMMFNLILMIFIVVPATLPTIIATYSIVGEKNNRSLEPLLATPTTDGELLAGKIFSSFIPSMGSTYLAFVLGVGLLDVVLIPHVGYPPLPNVIWILAILLIAPAACLMSVLACVLVSSKVSDVRAAQQLGGFVVMPVVVLMLGVLSGLLLLSPFTVIVFAFIYSGIDLGLFYFARAVFNRESILTKWT
ncbi:MAG TPA: ABC transporter permease subunit [Candidatus Thermoplasmatota archaeon]|nr:ABC transporter permease subunit [Candidatus Thermoplasmatota archaeon]